MFHSVVDDCFLVELLLLVGNSTPSAWAWVTIFQARLCLIPRDEAYPHSTALRICTYACLFALYVHVRMYAMLMYVSMHI
jgi:hypothetical protein